MDQSDYPSLFRDADEASLAAQRRYVGLVRADLSLVVGAAILGVASSLASGEVGTAIAVVTAIVLLGAFTARLANRLLRDERAWFDGRAVAESAKSLTWQFMMRAGAFSTPGVDAPAAEQRLVMDLWQLRKERKDLRLVTSASTEGGQITSRMRNVWSKSLDERRAVYIEARLNDQMSWYRNKASQNQRSVYLWFAVGLGAQLLALVAAVVRIVALPSLNFIGLFSAIAASATAWTQLRRHDELTRSYGLAADELSMLKELLEQAVDEHTFFQRIEEIEGAISREHTMWVAKRGS
jgi:hypothetical protein